MKYVRTRRGILEIGGSALAMGVLAGCLSIGGSDSTDDGSSTIASNTNSGSPTAASSFAVLGDFAAGVAGDAASVNTLVPVGQHGHGWSPSPQVQREVLNSDLFIYMAEGFQPWADDIVTNITNGGTSVTVVEARHGINLLTLNAHNHSENDHGHDENKYRHEENYEHITKEGDRHKATHHSEHTNHNTTAGHDTHETEGSHVHTDKEGHTHDHGGVDPHFWLDPQRSKQAVENIREGFTTVDADNAETYADNAAAYTQRLDDLDQQFESALKNTPKDAVLVAGHSAYQYFGHEYGFEVKALTGISPDDQPTPKDIARAQNIINEHGIEYILSPVLESDRAATQLVQQTDAKGHLPITAIAGITKEWQQKNWGYIELMKNINLPSLKKALGAT